MSERAYLNCHVYVCPEPQLDAARAALGQWGPWGEYEDDPLNPVDGRTALTDITCDTVPEIAAALRQAAPGASWVAWEEPASSGSGRVIAFTPALGQHEGECDRAGETVIGRSAFEALRELHGGEALIAALDASLGGPWARDYAGNAPAAECQAHEAVCDDDAGRETRDAPARP